MRCIRAEMVVSQAQGRVGDPIDMPPAGAGEAPVLRLDNVVASYGRHEVVHSVSLSLAARECLALVGESGSGKTTVARAIAGLHRGWTGTIALGDAQLQPAARHRSGDARRRIQYIFQNPYGSLNPRRTVGQIIAQPLENLTSLSYAARVDRVEEVLTDTSLGPDFMRRFRQAH